MKLFFTRKKWQQYRESLAGSLGFVPTMGALHDGHLKLVHQAKQHHDAVVVSIFVNPKQFNKQEDLLNYPKTLFEDLVKLQNAGVNAVFLPNLGEVYPLNDNYVTALPGKSAVGLEGDFRPGHFEGVVNVVDRLFHWINPHTAFFGQKDLQQCLVIQEFAAKKYPNLNITTVSTERESSGLAMSSRNMRLSTEGREKAAAIFYVLNRLKDFPRERDWAIAYLAENGISTEYLQEINLQLSTADGEMNRAWVFAGYLEGIRLIDNILFQG